nr:PREDICTED: ubiquitin-conjugating enzyme E2 N isoform X2 [Anolis carolinensis]|eukprot:XP_016849236.1 PREDICTED: ubiquitin-conjugating enzyme E2 N isoform X2 [Anolis carolinensis]
MLRFYDEVQAQPHSDLPLGGLEEADGVPLREDSISRRASEQRPQQVTLPEVKRGLLPAAREPRAEPKTQRSLNPDKTRWPGCPAGSSSYKEVQKEEIKCQTIREQNRTISKNLKGNPALAGRTCSRNKGRAR